MLWMNYRSNYDSIYGIVHVTCPSIFQTGGLAVHWGKVTSHRLLSFSIWQADIAPRDKDTHQNCFDICLLEGAVGVKSAKIDLL